VGGFVTEGGDNRAQLAARGTLGLAQGIGDHGKGGFWFSSLSCHQ
jgi:hypothetical protein